MREFKGVLSGFTRGSEGYKLQGSPHLQNDIILVVTFCLDHEDFIVV